MLRATILKFALGVKSMMRKSEATIRCVVFSYAVIKFGCLLAGYFLIRREITTDRKCQSNSEGYDTFGVHT